MKTEAEKLEYQYNGAVEELKTSIFDHLKAAGLPITEGKNDSQFAILVSKESPKANPVFIFVNVSVMWKHSEWRTGVLISYSGYAMSQREGFSRHMRPTWDEDKQRWMLKEHDLVRKTKMALKHAADVDAWREKRKRDMAVLDGNVKKAFPAYAVVPEGDDSWPAPLSIYGNRVIIETPWGVVDLQTDDGEAYTIGGITFEIKQTKAVDAATIHELIAKIGAAAQLVNGGAGSS